MAAPQNSKESDDGSGIESIDKEGATGAPGVRMKETLFECSVEFDHREIWIEIMECGVSHWYDRAGALDTIPETLSLELRAFMENLAAGGDGRTARRLVRDRENFTILVELSKPTMDHIRHVACLSRGNGMTSNDEAKLDGLLDRIYQVEVLQFLPVLEADS